MTKRGADEFPQHQALSTHAIRRCSSLLSVRSRRKPSPSFRRDALLECEVSGRSRGRNNFE